MMELARARHASKKATKLIGHERYSEASFIFEHARELYRQVGDYERAAVACVEAITAMNLAKKKREGGDAAPPSSEMQAIIIGRWHGKIREMTLHKSGAMSIFVDKERKLGQKH